jgi:hypothetical protein
MCSTPPPLHRVGLRSHPGVTGSVWGICTWILPNCGPRLCKRVWCGRPSSPPFGLHRVPFNFGRSAFHRVRHMWPRRLARPGILYSALHWDIMVPWYHFQDTMTTSFRQQARVTCMCVLAGIIVSRVVKLGQCLRTYDAVTPSGTPKFIILTSVVNLD